MEKLKQGDIAIIDYYKFSQPKKVEVLEETETTYLLLDMDYEKGALHFVSSDLLANAENVDIKKVIENFKEWNVNYQWAENSEPRVEVLAAKFRITKQEFEKTYKVIEMVLTMEQKIANAKFHGDVLKRTYENKDKKD